MKYIINQFEDPNFETFIGKRASHPPKFNLNLEKSEKRFGIRSLLESGSPVSVPPETKFILP